MTDNLKCPEGKERISHNDYKRCVHKCVPDLGRYKTGKCRPSHDVNKQVYEKRKTKRNLPQQQSKSSDKNEIAIIKEPVTEVMAEFEEPIQVLPEPTIPVPITEVTKKKCREGQELNPVTGRCITKCPEGYERIPNTTRCRKIPKKAENKTRKVAPSVTVVEPSLIESISETIKSVFRPSTEIPKVPLTESSPEISEKPLTEIPQEIPKVSLTESSPEILKEPSTEIPKESLTESSTEIQEKPLTEVLEEPTSQEPPKVPEFMKESTEKEESIIEPSSVAITSVVGAEEEAKTSETPSVKEPEQEKEEEIKTSPELEDVMKRVPKDRNEKLFLTEKREYEYQRNNNTYDFLYPNLNDPNFNKKIAIRKEFFETQYDGNIYNIKDQADKMCGVEFTLNPHQLFAKNFMSSQTPYNSLLLYHNLGSGKTCTAISVAEEMRSYTNQVGLKERIIIIASENVQDNFRLQLFDEKKLKFENGIWNIQSCVGASLLREINPSLIVNKETDRQKIIQQIKSLIHQNYEFVAYGKFANFIKEKTEVTGTAYDEQQKKRLEIKKIRHYFSNRLLIIDEVHNIRIGEGGKKTKKIFQELIKIARYSENMRLLLLSATPMYNSYKEIIHLVNLLNINDKRATIQESDIFDKEGNFLPERPSTDGKDTLEGGKELLARKIIGYISYVRGENPYTFPYRVYPNVFEPDRTFSTIEYPKLQMNGKPIVGPIKHLSVYLSEIGDYQLDVYNRIIDSMYSKMDFENMEKFGYAQLQMPLQALNIVYPSASTEEGSESMSEPVSESMVNESEIQGGELSVELKKYVGIEGLSETMNYEISSKSKFEYKKDILEKYGRFLSPDAIPSFSSRIHTICQRVLSSTGIVLIYSEFIDGGIIPLALALEEIGFRRYYNKTEPKTRSLWKTPPSVKLDALSMKPKTEMDPNAPFTQARYVIISGEHALSPDNNADIKYITSEENKDGALVKVVIISKSAAEGVDLRNIRQIHIMDAWYNMNRIEQIIGRGVRHLSHCSLPFEKRNVEIYLHGSVMPSLTDNDETRECADVYLYRYAENKAIQIGRVTRLLKENSVDCLLNIGQTNMTTEKLLSLTENRNIQIELSTNAAKVEFQIGDKPYTDICDYMDNCAYQCSPVSTSVNEADVIKDTYNQFHIQSNYTKIADRIRQIFRESPTSSVDKGSVAMASTGQVFYKLQDLLQLIQVQKKYPIEHIFYTLTYLIDHPNEYLTDKYGRLGNLQNRGKYYMFQPIEITDENATVFDRSVPVDYKRTSLELEIPEKVTEDIDGMGLGAEMEQGIEPSVQDIQKIIQESHKETADSYKRLKSQLLRKIDEFRKTTVVRDIRDWTENFNYVYPIIMENHKDLLPHYEKNAEHLLKKFFVYHFLDELTYKKKLVLIQHLYSTDVNTGEYLEKTMKEYFDELVVYNQDKTSMGVILVDEKDVHHIFLPPPPASVQASNASMEIATKWVLADNEDLKPFEKSIIQKLHLDKTRNINQYFGFLTLHKDEIVFKMMNMLSTTNKVGFIVSQAGKAVLIQWLNTILGKTIYTKENTNDMTKMGITVLLEMLLRLSSHVKKDGKVWFLNREIARFNQRRIRA